MPKRRSAAKNRTPLVLAVLAGLALVLFLGGELFAFVNSDRGAVAIFDRLHLGDRARVIRLVGKRVHEGLEQARVKPDRVSEDVVPGPSGGTPRWRVSLPREGSPLQVNYAVSRAIESDGARVLLAREAPGPDGALDVEMRIGVRSDTLQQLVIARPARAPRDGAPPRQARIALVLTGLTESPDLAATLLARSEPFAVAVPGVGRDGEVLARAARKAGHELVLHVPMEPVNYPKVNPGPGTLLVSMDGSHIEHGVRAELKQAGSVVAVANMQGSFATQDEPFVTALYRALRAAGVPFLHVAPVPRSVCRSLASQLGVAYDESDVTLDAEARAAKPAALEHAWKAALEHARAHGRTIVVIKVTPLSAAWLERALAPKQLGDVAVVPLSSVIHHPGTP